MLQITNLRAIVAETPILSGVSLSVNAVEAQKLMGVSVEGSVA